MSDFESVIHLFQARVAAAPKSLAVESAEGSLSYQELDSRSSQLSRYLLGLNVSRGDIVALASSRKTEMAIGILGILKSGAAYLPIDPSYPVERLTFMLEDAEPVHLLTAMKTELNLDLACHRTCLIADWPEIEKASANATPAALEPGDLAYVIYTSGSSGVPKGVLLEHLGLAEMALAHVQAFSIDQSSRVLQFSSFCFDASVSEIFMTLCGGGTLCMATAEQLTPGRELVLLLDDREISNVLLPPSALALLPVKPLPALRTLISGGEPCPRELVQRWAIGRDFFNAYGPTEGTVTATIHRCSPDEELDPPIGSARDFMDTYVLNESGDIVSEEETGELCIAGNGVARGYLNRPELTAERYVDDPFVSTVRRMYRTGDLVKKGRDGFLYFLERLDRQVKVRGFRVELGEIESVLAQHKSVEIAAAVLHDFNNQDKRIVAYYTVPTGEVPSQAELRGWVESKLPAYAVPSHFTLIEKMPLRPNGKIDYDALDLPAITDAGDLQDVGSQELKTCTTSERMIHDIWCSVIGISPAELSVDSHFIEVGGDSLLSVRIALELEKKGVSILTQDLFSHPTIRELSSFIESR